MKRIAASAAALICALALPGPALASHARAGKAAAGTISGRVTDVEGGTFTVQTAGRAMGVINALVASANRVARGDYPYVWGGGHAEAGVASVGSRGPGHNGRRLGFDCSGSVAAVLAGAGLWRWGSGVPNDAGVIGQLRSEHLIARGAGRAPAEVTLYDDPGVHIFMNIDGRFFGTSDGGGGGNRRGGAGWLYDGAWDATSRAFKQYHILPGVLKDRTVYGHDFTFADGVVSPLALALQIGDRVRVGYEQDSAGGMTATSLAWAGAATAGGTLIEVALDGSSFQVQLPSGQVLTLSTNGLSGVLAGASVGDGVSVTYTSHSGTLTARAVQVTSPAQVEDVSGTVLAVAADGSSFTVQVPGGQTMTFSTAGAASLLSAVATGDTVQVGYFTTASGALVAQQVNDGGQAAQTPPQAAPWARRSR